MLIENEPEAEASPGLVSPFMVKVKVWAAIVLLEEFILFRRIVLEEEKEQTGWVAVPVPEREAQDVEEVLRVTWEGRTTLIIPELERGFEVVIEKM